MHKKSNNVNILCFSNENFINSLNEIKSFFSFNIIKAEANQKDGFEEKYNAVIVEEGTDINSLISKIKIPKIFIKKKNSKKSSETNFELILRFPINVVNFNKSIIELCKKFEFEKNSKIKIKDYTLDKNERILKKGNKALKITEKEIHFVEMLSLSNKPLDKDFILKNIWQYSSDSDTHTIETHIYRLRQKIKESFGDNNFIKNTKKGYSL